MKRLIPILLAVIAFAACQKDPDLDKLDNDYLVFTNYDQQADFASFNTYYIPDSILLITDKAKAEYWSGAQAEEIINAYITNMQTRGYTRVDDKDEADLGIQVSYVASTYYFTSYTSDPYWWNGYPGYWNSYYWGNWGYWYYPYPITYSYSTGSILTDMVNLKAPQGEKEKLPVVWNSYISGLLSYTGKISITRTVKGVDQSFTQSPYLQGRAK